ncbi:MULTISPECIES: hypothetical protein [Chloroflexales]|jgi:hypothetical protein|uniref:hypothetical protein n=1 Tax=Chloroflexales TaxID=32064 RepID=UPI000319BAE0|nr:MULTISPECIES: hypothetical protein [Chloroflexales]
MALLLQRLQTGLGTVLFFLRRILPPRQGTVGVGYANVGVCGNQRTLVTGALGTFS